jgi:hypothetical protein
VKTIRRILFTQPKAVALCATVIALSLAPQLASLANATTTKVGNGDDGADLEALKPITSGPIFTSRTKAVETLKKLSVMGVPGLGLLIPEVERTDLLLASKDVHPTGEQSGSLEISEDNQLVYARTFAEPYAATRFFPSAQTLTSDQLVALHIHEALHRALPANIRENENIVMHLTMAMTSPGASFDRTKSVAALYIQPETRNVAQAPAPVTAPAEATLSANQKIVLPPKSRTQFGYGVDFFSNWRYTVSGNQRLHGFELATSLGGYRKIASQTVEPVFRARVKLTDERAPTSFVGPSSLELQGRIPVSDDTQVAPFLRFTAKSLDASVSVPAPERDIISLGAMYNYESSRSYVDGTLNYSLPSSSSWGNEYDGSHTTKYNSILTVGTHSGFKFGIWNVGGIAELHASQGYKNTNDNPGYSTYSESRRDAFRLLVLGPEIGFTTKRFKFRAYGKWVMNDTNANLTSLADVMDRGADWGSMGSSLSMLF